ncbi:ATP-grasp domain-containing protein [Enterococcus saccharolyticus]|uniref:Carboxylate--amine ligase n=1 Tax=Candidatus Enterococcus willemsii TaxID=1857215 RepID=A0ABQ6YY64_9ENTE|nr:MULTISPECIES: ATP-grasp domain-containing protein [Enterococcus]KAF1303002.1 carboxylate--amine ligase [Enterococcus sp. CU12B]MCD5001646.1 ATP-grasp domain-containing protein [Enterococcus saccharolyticus]
MDNKLNFVMISPHFPDNFATFAPRLKEAGFRTLGIADAPYDQLSQTLKDSLLDYYRVDNMEDYDQVYRAVAFFAHKYGRIHRIESHNEHWLELDARLRTDFNVFGYKEADLDAIKHKSSMKAVFRQIGLPVADGRVFTDFADAKTLIDTLGYPVIIKPDSGVGAGDTYKIKNDEELAHFFDVKNDAVTYIMEEFIPGDIVTFDGLTDHDGNILYYSSLLYNVAVLETVENDNDMYFYVSREVPDDLYEMGSKMVQAFNTKERFFHFEFFRLADGSLLPLEVNLRPPGGSTIDMFNYANDFDIFAEYANVVKDNRFYAPITRPYYCGYVSRKYSTNHYVHSNDDIRRHLGDSLIAIQTIPGIFATIMGDEGYLVRTPSEEQLFEYFAFIRQKY